MLRLPVGKGIMRAIQTLIRVSAERLTTRQQPGWLTPGRSRAIVICVLAAGFLLVVIWAFTLLYLLFQIIAFAFG
jgi:hypothetical protein